MSTITNQSNDMQTTAAAPDTVRTGPEFRVTYFTDHERVVIAELAQVSDYGEVEATVTGSSKTAPGDRFDYQAGEALALLRALNKLRNKIVLDLQAKGGILD